MQGAVCSIPGKHMKVFKEVSSPLKKFASFFFRMVFLMFCQTDFARMILKITLADNLQLVVIMTTLQ